MHPINIFANKNRLKLKSYDKKILIADRTLPEANFINSIASYILNEKYKFSADVITDARKENINLKIYNAFNINHIIFLSIKYNFSKFILLIKSIFYASYYFLKTLLFGSNWFLKNSNIKIFILATYFTIPMQNQILTL